MNKITAALSLLISTAMTVTAIKAYAKTEVDTEEQMELVVWCRPVASVFLQGGQKQRCTNYWRGKKEA